MFLRPATPLSILFLVALVCLLLSTLSTPVIKSLPLASYQGVDYGVFGACKGSQCSGIKMGYNPDTLFSNDNNNADFTLPASTRHSLSSILLVHPVAAFFALVGFVLSVLAHTRPAAHSPRYLLAMLILIFPTLLISLLAFLVDILLFAPHMQVGCWIVLAATVILAASGIVTCAMRRTLVSRKANKRKQLENELQPETSSGFTYTTGHVTEEKAEVVKETYDAAEAPPALISDVPAEQNARYYDKVPPPSTANGDYPLARRASMESQHSVRLGPRGGFGYPRGGVPLRGGGPGYGPPIYPGPTPGAYGPALRGAPMSRGMPRGGMYRGGPNMMMMRGRGRGRGYGGGPPRPPQYGGPAMPPALPPAYAPSPVSVPEIDRHPGFPSQSPHGHSRTASGGSHYLEDVPPQFQETPPSLPGSLRTGSPAPVVGSLPNQYLRPPGYRTPGQVQTNHPYDHEQQMRDGGARSPASSQGSQSSHFTSISQRAPAYPQRAPPQRTDILAGNPDFALTGAGGGRFPR